MTPTVQQLLVLLALEWAEISEGQAATMLGIPDDPVSLRELRERASEACCRLATGRDEPPLVQSEPPGGMSLVWGVTFTLDDGAHLAFRVHYGQAAARRDAEQVCRVLRVRYPSATVYWRH